MCFSVREAKVPVRLKQPSLLREILRRKNVLKFFAAMTLQWIGLWMLSAFFVIANMALFGLSVERAIKAFFVMNVSFVLFALPAGLLANKLGLKRTTISGMAIMIVSFCCVSFVKSYSALIVLMVISGIGYGTVLAVSYPFFLSLLPEGNTAGFVGFYHACQNGTLLIGPVVGGFMVDHFGYTTLFYGAAAVMLAGLITYTIVRNPEGRVRN
jgi:MFS family permease